MKSKITKYIIILLACLLFSPQICAQLNPDLEPKPEEVGDGGPFNPFEIDTNGDSFTYTRNHNYGSTHLVVYYRMKLEKAMIVTFSSYCNVPLQTTITRDEGGFNYEFHHNEGLKDTLLLPGTYTIFQGAYDSNIYISVQVTGKIANVPDPDDNEKETAEKYTPSRNMNYIHSYIPTSVVNTIDSLYYLSKARHSIRYYDHLGRPSQEVAYKASPGRKDIAVSHEYDALGRNGKQWLPVMRSNKKSTGTFIPQDSVAIYARDAYSDQAAFSYPLYEASPLNRIIENYGPGTAWQSTGHSAKSSYRTNTTTDACLYLAVSGTSDNPQLVQKGVYPASELAVVESKDEDGHTLIRFTDREGHVVLSRNVSAQETLDTYYVYNDLGSLCFVLPPLASAQLSSTPSGTALTGILDKHAYQYRYDYRKRCIGKKLPACDWIEMVYDHNNRLVFSRDGEQKKRNECLFTLSDLLGRQVLSGVYQGALPARSTCDAADIYAVFSPTTTGAREGYRINCPAGITLSSLKVLQANYYDNYTFATALTGFGGSLGYAEDANYGKRYTANPILHCKDLLTGRMTLALETNQRLYSTCYYDYNRNLIQERSTTPNGKTLVIKSSFNFSGQPVKVAETCGTEVSFQKSYNYDHMGRLTREVHTLGTDQTSFAYSYDLQDRVTRLARFHGNDSVVTINQYDIRSQLTAIRSPRFTQTLYYTNGNGTPCYNGNISSMKWTGSDNVARGYKFTYDGLDRMKDAVYGEGNLLTANLNRFTEKVTGYDKNGNIKALQRYGQTSATAYGLVDNLTYVLDGNRLTRVDDAVTGAAYNGGFEFKNVAGTAQEYYYDLNGNLTKDSNKGITEIKYNVLNLPSKITFGSASNQISYVYSADGTKLSTVHTIGGVSTTTYYCGNAVYEGSAAKLLLTGNGYIALSDKKYHYYLKDQQGNNRAVVSQTGALEEMNHYYPFGGVFANTGNVQPYKYNDKELNAKLGLNWYDYGARHYDAALGRWHVADPLAEKYYGTSLYAYCENNPVNRVDPDGMASRYNWNTRRYEDESGNQVSWENVQKEYGIGGNENIPDVSLTAKDVDAVTGAAPVVAKMNIYNSASDGLITGEPPFLPGFGAFKLASLWKMFKTLFYSKNAVNKTIQSFITFGQNDNQVYHAFRHVDDLGLSREVVSKAIIADFSKKTSQIVEGKAFNQIIEVEGHRLQYTVFKLSNGIYNIGRIHGIN